VPVTDWHFGGAAATIDRGTSGQWVSPTYALADNGQYSYHAIAKLTYGDYLRLTSFGFDSDVPSGATIDGIELLVMRAATNANKVYDSDIFMLASTGHVGSDQAVLDYWPQTTPAQYTYGGSANKWGSSINAAEIRATTFGFDISPFNEDDTNPQQGQVWYAKARIYYTPSFNSAWYAQQRRR